MSLAIVALSASSLSATALAQSIMLGPGTGDPFKTTHTITPGTNQFNIVGGPFEFNQAAGPWIKNLQAPAGGWIPGGIYALHETFTFFPPAAGLPPEPITDWHERIDFGPDGIVWDVWVGEPMFSVGTAPAPGLMTMFNPGRTEVWFFFDPILPGPNGVTFTIWKEFQFIGMQPSFDPVRIIEYPTPAPGGVALLALGGMIAAGRRRRA